MRTSRVSRHGPATAALLHATSQVKVDSTKPEEGSLEARKARVLVRVMNPCYDDADNLSLSRVVSQSNWTLNWDALVHDKRGA